MDHAEQLARTLDATGMPREPRAFQAAGNMEQRAEDASINLATTGVYRFRRRHPFWYGLIAFVVGVGLVEIFIVMSFSTWGFEGINFTRALYEVVFAGLAGGIALAALAFAYAARVREVARLDLN